MITFWSAVHGRHRPASELIDGHLQPHVEVPARAELVLAAVRDRALGDVVEVGIELIDDTDRLQAGSDRVAVERVHEARFVAFLEGAWAAWTAEGRTWDALPMVWPTPVLTRRDEPDAIDGRLSYWSFDAGTPITAGTWDAAWAAARVALAAQHAVADGASGAAFALCRPPGHHAAATAYGGYCYLNNAAIAAQSFVDGGAERVAVVDIDYHHGNGTQSIFWERPDVLTVSLHADPRQEYPYFLGHADETGGGAGAGANLNLPMPWGTGFDRWSAALDDACGMVSRFGPDAVVVALGVDTHEADPISHFELRSDDYLRVGSRLAALGRPTVFVMEGGYATDVIGANVANVLSGFADASPHD